tara:strand:+ start:1133 stop:1504 length:372 start_codon:yes stop_codon:yes gene_type:complete
MKNIKNIINEISKKEKIENYIFKNYIKSFEKYIKSEIKKYDDKYGLEDFKMNKYDYQILYELYVNTSQSPYKIYILLLYMYSYYKLDGISFEPEKFPINFFFNFIKFNNNIHSIILKSITNFH